MLHERRKWLTKRAPEDPAADGAPSPARRAGKINLLTQILLAILFVGLLPFTMLSISALRGYSSAGRAATESAVRLLDQKSLEALQVTAEQLASRIAGFLESCVDNTTAAALLPRTPEAYLAFYRLHEREISYPDTGGAEPRELRKRLPFYREMAYIDAGGQEQLKIVDGQLVADGQLRNVSDPGGTTYRTEDYFAATGALQPGQVYVSPLTAAHTSLQIAASAAAVDPGAAFADYQGIVRFGTPLFDAAGAFDGIVLLTLDYRHVLEYVVHLQPLGDDAYTLYADYNSGNYAYIFDADGYIIGHPVLARMRGLDENGQLLGPITQHMTAEQQDQHPFNLRFAGWSEPQLPGIVEAVLRDEDGFAITRNLLGTEKASAYAPIRLAHNADRGTSIFGGVVIGANLNDFSRSATQISANIKDEQERQTNNTLWIAAAGIVLLTATAALISRSVTRPMYHLTRAASAMEQGTLDTDSLNLVKRRPLEDEVTKLAAVFHRMAEQVQLRELNFKQQIQNLRIQVDEQKQREHVSEITETAYFQELQQRAEALRNKRREPPAPEQPAASDDTQE